MDFSLSDEQREYQALGPFVVGPPGGVHAELYGERAMRPAPVTPPRPRRWSASAARSTRR